MKVYREMRKQYPERKRLQDAYTRLARRSNPMPRGEASMTWSITSSTSSR